MIASERSGRDVPQYRTTLARVPARKHLRGRDRILWCPRWSELHPVEVNKQYERFKEESPADRCRRFCTGDEILDSVEEDEGAIQSLAASETEARRGDIDMCGLNRDDDPGSSELSELSELSECTSDGDPDDDDAPKGCIRAAGTETTRGINIWRGRGYDDRPMYIPQNLDYERYAGIWTVYGGVAVPAHLAEMTENMRAYMPTSVRLYLQSLSQAMIPNDAPDEVVTMMHALLKTYNPLMKPSCQPICRQWEKTGHPILGVVLMAAVNGKGKVGNAVRDWLMKESLGGLMSPQEPWSFDGDGHLVLKKTGQRICEKTAWDVGFLVDHLHRESARKLPKGEDRFRATQEVFLRRNLPDPRILSRPSGRVDRFGRPVICALGEYFSEDPEWDEEDSERVPLNVFTRNPEQRHFARRMGCTMHHEPESRFGIAIPSVLGPEVPGLEQDGRRQAVNDIR
jgi:hypothetical protein